MSNDMPGNEYLDLLRSTDYSIKFKGLYSILFWLGDMNYEELRMLIKEQDTVLTQLLNEGLRNNVIYKKCDGKYTVKVIKQEEMPLLSNIEESRGILLPKHLDTDRFRAVWDKWTEYRRKLSRTPAGGWLLFFKRQLEFVSQYRLEDAIEMIETSMTNGWQGLFPKPKMRKINQQPDINRQISYDSF